jgi:hypothetical protein
MSGFLSAFVGGSYGAKPDAPTIGTATATGTTTATVSYSAPASNGGVAITSYTATSNPGGITGTLSQAGNGTITISGLTAGTAYTFTVTATNSVGTSSASSASNSITTYSVPVNTVAPAVTGTAWVGQTLSCTTGTWTGIPAPSYTYQWFRGASSISGAASSTYTIVSADIGNTLYCRVTATNAAASTNANSNTTATVIGVSDAPTIGTATVTGTGSATVSYTAPASNNGSAITSYTAVSSPGGITGTLSTAASGTITVSGLSSNTAYTFTVYATNTAGNSLSSAASNNITTYSVPSNTVAPAVSGTTYYGYTLSCTTGTWTGNPASFSYSYQWIRGGSTNIGSNSNTYTLVAADVGNTISCTVTATNTGGSTSASSNSSGTVVAVAPNAPTIGTATASGLTTATLTFTESTDNGGSAITSHFVFSNPAVNAGQIVGNSPVTVTGLSPGTSYTFTVATNNGVGTSSTSTASNSITTYSVPSNTAAPAIGGATYVGQALSCSTGTWTGNPASFSYSYQWKRAGSTNIGTNSSSYTLVSADLGNAISCTVTATNSGGSTSANSNSTASVTTTAGAPTIGTATVTGTDSATVSYTAPASNGGNTITSYVAVSSPGNITGTLSTAGNGTITVSGLSSNTAYTFTVYAVNAAGNSSSSSASNSITTYSIPANTAAPVVSGTTSFGSTLSCTTGTWTGNPASFSYAYQWRRSGSNISGANSSSYTLVSADVGTTLNCVVAATNSGGTSESASNTTAAITATIPGTPTIGTATSTGQTTATVAFTAPASNGGSTIISYTATSSPGGRTGTLSQAGSGTITITGLTSGTAYTFTVYATNAIGNSSSSAASNSITTTVAAPTYSSGLSISGNAWVGQTLSAIGGSWTNSPTGYTYQWIRGVSDISGATGSQYVVTATDLGNTLAVRVTASNAGGSNSATSSNTATVITVPGAPTIGTASSTQTTGAAVTFTAPGSNGGSAITSYTAIASPGGASQSAVASPITVSGLSPGTAYTFTVYATNAAGNSTSSSASNSVTTYRLPYYTTAPTISGTQYVGQSISLNIGSWSGNPASFTYGYQWQRNGTNISGATSISYIITSTDNGNTLSCYLTVLNSAGTTNYTATAGSAVAYPPPVNLSLPTISNTPAYVGVTLGIGTGSWQDASTYAYQWLRAGINITGATTNSYTVTSTDIGYALSCRVTATGSGGSTSATSASTNTVTVAPPTNTAAPTISGTAQVGQVLTASVGTWTGSPSYGYQWLRAGTSISGATGFQYTLTSTDVGNGIACTITATNAGGSTSATSAYTTTVTYPAPVNLSAPVVSISQPYVGDNISASSGSWQDASSYAYQWLRAGTSISGATSQGYTVTSADVGNGLACSVTATGTGGSTSVTTSYTSAVIQQAIALTGSAAPYISAYPWSGGFGTKYNDPTTTAGGVTYAIDFNPQGTVIATANSTSPAINAWLWSNSGFGTKFGNPSVSSGTINYGVDFDPTGTTVVSSSSSTPYVHAYPWSSSGFGTRFSSPASTPGNFSVGGVAFNPSSTAIAVGFQTTVPYIAAYPWTNGVGWGTRYADPTTGPATTTYKVTFNPQGTAIASANSTSSPFINVWAWSSGFGTKFADPATLMSGQTFGVAFSPSGLTIAGVSTSTANIHTWPWSSGGFGTKYANPSTLPTGSGARAVTFNVTSTVIASTCTTSPYINAYQWIDGFGFGVKYADPTTLPTAVGTSYGSSLKFFP